MTSSRGGSPLRILPDFSESSGSRQKSPAAAPGCHPNFPREGRFLQAVLTDQSPLCQQPGPADLGTRHQLQQDRGGWDFRYHLRLNHHHLSSSRQEEFEFHKLWASSSFKKERKLEDRGTKSRKPNTTHKKSFKEKQ